MIENLLKSNFLGRDGFRWWIGQIPPTESWALHYKKKKDAWGNRVKVRIMGYHPQNTVELPDEDLPWATVILPTNNGSGKAGFRKPIRISQGDIVVGFFLDGDDAQQPVIFGVIANSKYVVNGEPGPFKPFSGYTPETTPGNKVIVKGRESNDDNELIDKKVINADRKLIENIKQKTGDDLVRSTSSVMGDCVSFAGTPAQNQMKIELGNAVKAYGSSSVADKQRLVTDASKTMTGISNSFIGELTKTAMTSLAPKLNSGLDLLYSNVFATVLAATQNTAIAKKAGTAAQTAMVNPVAALQTKFPCVMEAIGNTMLGDIRSLLTSYLDNVQNSTACMSEQFTGAIFNKIVNGIGDALGPELGGVGKILGGFDLVNDLRGKAEGLLGIQEAIKCVAPGTANMKTNVWCLGKGPMNAPGVTGEMIMAAANAAQSLQEAAGAPGGVLGSLLGFGQFDFMNTDVSDPNYTGDCKASPPSNCRGVQIKLFGADGEGSLAEPIIGALVGDAFAQQTGSLIGIKLTNPGQGYTIPPLVEVTDNCDQGYGAHARAVIDYDPSSPTYQQVIDVYIVTPGENYPVIDENTNDNEYTVDHVTVINSGENYNLDDKITDNVGNEYEKILDEQGRILNVIPPNAALFNVKPVDGFPQLFIESSTGFGAIIKPQITPRPSYQGETKQIIDCITPRDSIVGYINGEPYYGAFHVHPTTGAKMVGAAHTTTAHSIIYDTPAESRSSIARVSTSTTVTLQQSSPVTDTTDSSTQSDSSMDTPPQSPPSSPPPSPPSSPPSGGGGYTY
ncbi:MAG: hypothetical protein CMM96_00225 [Rickettsiales bacterium]|nr:hypothetical protein [Rickettsiales bacterium]